MKPLTSYTCKLTDEQAATLKSCLEARSFTPREVPYARFAGEKEKTSVVFYESGKLVVQGKGTQEFVEFVLEPEVFDYIDGDDTSFEKKPLENLAKNGQLNAFKHTGFWQPRLRRDFIGSGADAAAAMFQGIADEAFVELHTHSPTSDRTGMRLSSASSVPSLALIFLSIPTAIRNACGRKLLRADS